MSTWHRREAANKMRLRQLGLMVAGIACFCVALSASSIPLGYVAWDVTLPGVSGEFDVVNQTGPNSSGDSTWPVTSEVQFSSLALTVLLDNGDTVVLGPSYFLPNPDGESFDGSQISIGSGDPLPVMVTLTGTINPTSIMLFDGSITTLASTFNVSFSDSPNLQDGDLAIIYAQATPEPATWLPIGAGLIGLNILLFARGRRAWTKAAIVAGLVASPIAGTREAKAAAWAKAGDSCATMNPGAATPWDAWMQAVAPDPRAKKAGVKTTTDWTFLAADNTVRVTPAMAGGNPFDSEGPYCRTIANNFGNFYLNIQYQVVAGRVTPKGPDGIKTDQDFGNSGIYIFDRWEVQIIDPSQFDDDNNKPGVATGNTIQPDPRIPKAAFQRNTQVPGSLYGADPVRSDDATLKGDKLFLNQANAAGNWNTLEITFCVVKADGITPIRPPQLLSNLNGNTVYYGAVPANGTGGRAGAKAVFEGPIYLQSHWGSQVQFRNPTFDATKAKCPLP